MSELNEDRIDLAALDPADDAVRWERILSSTIARVDHALAARAHSPIEMIASWSRPLLVAAAVAVALLVPAEVALEQREERVQRVQRLVAISVDWAYGAATPSGSDLRRAVRVEQSR